MGYKSSVGEKRAEACVDKAVHTLAWVQTLCPVSTCNMEGMTVSLRWGTPHVNTPPALSWADGHQELVITIVFVLIGVNMLYVHM